MNLRYNTTRLLVDNFSAMFTFYKDVLGLIPRFGSADDVYAEFQTGNVALALFSRALMTAAIANNPSPISASNDCLALSFHVDDVDAAYKALTALGATAVSAPRDQPDWFLRVAHIRDPENNLIELNTPLKPASKS